MDTLYLSRISMGGWLFVVVVISAVWNGDFQTRSALLQSIPQYAKDAGPLMAALFGALVGIGTPPAIGFLFERLVSFVLSAWGYSMWNYRSVESFEIQLAGESTVPEGESPEGSSALFHVAFYSCAHTNLIDFARRHRAQMYGSWIGAVAIIGGLLATVRVFSGVRSLICYTAWLSVALILSTTAVKAGRQHRAIVDSWATICGPLVRKWLFPNTDDSN